MIWTQFLFNWLSLHNTFLCLGCPSGVWRFLHCRRANMLSRSLGRDFRSLVNSIHTTAFPQLDHPCQSLVASGHISHTISSHPCGINSETPLVTVSSGKCLVSPKPWNHSTLSQPLRNCSSLEQFQETFTGDFWFRYGGVWLPQTLFLPSCDPPFLF